MIIVAIIIPQKIIIICLQISRLVLVEKVTVSLEHDRVLRETGQLYNFDQPTPHIGRRGKFYIVYLHPTNSTPQNVRRGNSESKFYRSISSPTRPQMSWYFNNKNSLAGSFPLDMCTILKQGKVQFKAQVGWVLVQHCWMYCSPNLTSYS